jgi:hypothetical protein
MRFNMTKGLSQSITDAARTVIKRSSFEVSSAARSISKRRRHDAKTSFVA